MKNLISLFFVISLGSAFSQTSLKKDIESKSIVKTEHHVKLEQEIALVDTEPEKPVENDISTGNVKSDILNGFSTGNADLIAAYFPTNIDIRILGKSNLYSKSQAKQVLNTFFTQNEPTEFTVIHEGKSNGTKYFIGSYTSGESKYRVTINVKSTKTVEKISSISIERLLD